jgi:hypothetical protein
MLRKLNTAQRLWALGSTVFLATTIAVIAAAWPTRDAAIVAALAVPECEAVFDESHVREAPSVACQPITSFMDHERVIVRSLEEYDGYLWQRRARIALICLATWAALSGGFYLLGWSSASTVSALLRRGGAKDA